MKVNLTFDRLLSHASTESPFPEYTDAVLKLLLSKDKKQKSKAESDEVTTPAYATRELFRALLSNENLLNSRPFVGKHLNSLFNAKIRPNPPFRPASEPHSDDCSWQV